MLFLMSASVEDGNGCDDVGAWKTVDASVLHLDPALLVADRNAELLNKVELEDVKGIGGSEGPTLLGLLPSKLLLDDDNELVVVVVVESVNARSTENGI